MERKKKVQPHTMEGIKNLEPNWSCKYKTPTWSAIQKQSQPDTMLLGALTTL